jgi:hypothetical protein
MLGRNAWLGTTASDGLALTGEHQARLVAAKPPSPGSAALSVVSPEAVFVHRKQSSGSPATRSLTVS